MSLFDLQDVRIAIGSLATLDLPMVVDLIGIYGLKGPYFDRSDLIGDRSYDEAAAMDIVIWTRARWAGPSPLPSFGRPPSSLTSRRRRRRPRATADLRRKFVSGQFDEENPFMLISSALLVQPDEGVSILVVDRIGVNYRNLPRRAGFLSEKVPQGRVGAKHLRARTRASAEARARCTVAMGTLRRTLHFVRTHHREEHCGALKFMLE
ncbi:hypothetical protein F511_11785 [Dorcoceras hygrometricum]|uniref:Uncharacterized protein n=1 Tax=Dorcoceras hygrometricum TaxID=472368 RepID=A0A2Z7CES5_9LAMI|nr:hypothetical protein F511_11785 [Dorcoceras hygrometricum]